MKSFLSLALLATSVLGASAQAGVYCDTYKDAYSLYNQYGQDIGNSTFRDYSMCTQAADLSNYMQSDIVCAGYNKENVSGYSAYRVSDGKDLGHGVFGSFANCQDAIRETRAGLVCLVYKKSGTYSIYDIASGNDVGSSMYYNIVSCQAAY